MNTSLQCTSTGEPSLRRSHCTPESTGVRVWIMCCTVAWNAACMWGGTTRSSMLRPSASRALKP